MTLLKSKKLSCLCIGLLVVINSVGCAKEVTEEAIREEMTPPVIESEDTHGVKNIKVETEVIKEETDAYSVEVELPVLDGFNDLEFQNKINEDLKQGATDYIESITGMALEVKEEGYLTSPYYVGISYNILANTENYLTIEMLYNEYTGGAHGMYYSDYINYDVKGERVLALADIVDLNKPYMEVLNEAVLEAIEQARLESEYGDGLHSWYEGIEEESLAFSIEETGLGIHFQPYEIGPYAEGAPSFLIPYEKISEVLLLKQ